MLIGQHLIAVVLTLIGIGRAIFEGTPVAAALTAGLVVFVWYASGMVGSQLARPAWWITGLALVWVAAVAVSPEFVWLAFLIWLLAGQMLPRWWSVGLSFAVFLVVAVAPVAHEGTTTYANIIGPLIGGVFALGISRGYLELVRDARERERLVSSLIAAQREMADLHDELARAQRHSGAIAERTRLARDIHDTVAQGLSSIRLLAHARADASHDQVAVHAFRQVEALAQDSLADIRRIVDALAPAELEDNALATALERMLTRFQDQTGVATKLHVDESLPVLPTVTEAALLRTAQSALANVRQHAGANRVVVSLIDAEDVVRLDIIDDGRGFDVRRWDSSASVSESSYGLHFMRSRLRELAGGLEVESTPGEGTALSAFLPLYTVTEEM
ncbi:sensor histidine kinase [Natronoglycomyces albus]|uniref:Sensor histidine kinase n=2 Tax=Natronoglycomyces albus TaxID=2811108 RepID=A0A895XWV9_9ACTN|nr:sensor histidine kinase [Natronoglycomyces albus]